MDYINVTEAEFYSKNAKAYYEGTFALDVNHVYVRFLASLQKPLKSSSAGKQHIHYLGCSSEKTVLFEVQAIDSTFDVFSERLASV